MSGETSRTKQKTFHDTKIFFHKAFRNVRSMLSRGYAKLPRNAFTNPIFSGSSKIGPKMQETDSSCKSSSQRWDFNEAVSKKDGLLALKVHTNGVQGSTRVRRSEEHKARSRLPGKEQESSFLATEDFAKKMEELEMMDVSDGDHVMDIDEVVHCYSLLTSPTYLDIVDKFSKDVYRELNLPRPSRNVNNSARKLDSPASIHGSMRKLGSTSVHGSMRRLGCTTSVQTSMGKVGSDNAHGSIRKLSSANAHNSKRKLGSESLHGSMRRLSSDNIHGSMRKLGSYSIHGSMRRSGSDNVHGSTRKLGSDSIHGSMRKLGSDDIHGSMRKLRSDSVHGSMRKHGSDSVHGSMSMRKLGSDSIHGSMRKLGSESIYGSLRKLRSDSIRSSMRCQLS